MIREAGVFLPYSVNQQVNDCSRNIGIVRGRFYLTATAKTFLVNLTVHVQSLSSPPFFISSSVLAGRQEKLALSRRKIGVSRVFFVVFRWKLAPITLFLSLSANFEMPKWQTCTPRIRSWRVSSEHKQYHNISILPEKENGYPLWCRWRRTPQRNECLDRAYCWRCASALPEKRIYAFAVNENAPIFGLIELDSLNITNGNPTVDCVRRHMGILRRLFSSNPRCRLCFLMPFSFYLGMVYCFQRTDSFLC